MHPNVARALAGASIAVRLHRHSDFPEPIETPADFARQLGYGLPRITKTLLIRSVGGSSFALVVAPMCVRVNFAAVASAMGLKRMTIASASELEAQTGYPRNGVSPLGAPEIKVFLDDSLRRFETILIGAGEPGMEIEIKPQDLISLSGAVCLPLSIFG